MPVIDASVYVALLRPEETAHERCWTWFQTAVRAENGIVAPVILIPEVTAALGRGTGDRAIAQRAIEQLTARRIIQMFPVTRTMAEEAARVAADYRIRGCDAVYVALALQLEDSLVTLDTEQRERAAAVITTCAP